MIFSKKAWKTTYGKRLLSVVLTLVTIVTTFGYHNDKQPETQVYGVTKLSLSAAKSVAVVNSDRIESLELQIDAKQAAKVSAIRAMKEKQRSITTFRWSPLLNFSFPRDLTEAEAYEFAYKPVQLQYEIDTLEHKITDAKLDEYEKVSTIYVDIISSTAEINFLRSRMSNMEIALAKNRARLLEGTATQAQIDLQEKKLEAMKSSLASEQTKLERSKEKLGKEMGFSITTGYTFEESFQAMNIDRDNIEYLQSYALDRDQTVYEAKQNMELARLSLSTNYGLMRSQYGNNIGMISSYVQQALDGSSINKRAFKKDYDAFLKKIDEPWTGSYRILFFKFPKEWFKGDLDGIRYIEDDPYVLYSAALEYESALKDYNSACEELRGQVSDGYDAYIEARKAYMDAQTDLEGMKNEMINAEALNALGQMSLEEYDTIRSDYENSRSALKDALATYTKTLYEFDHTTCGGTSSFFVEESLTTQTGPAGLGTPGEEDVEDPTENLNAIIEKGATYSIRSIVDSEEFMLYIDIPEDFEYNVRQFELWSDGRQIGERVNVGESIQHLRLTLEDVDSVFIRLYDDQYSTDADNFIDDCSIDPTVSYGPLNITVGYEIKDDATERVIGTYQMEEDDNTDMIKLRFTFDQNAVRRAYQMGNEVLYFNMAAEQNLYLFSNDLISVDDPFTYMSFIKNDIGKLTLRMFSQDGTYIGGARIDTNTGKLYADEEVTEADMQEIAAKQILIEQRSSSLQSELVRMQDLLAAAESVNGQEADSATISYYKNRIEELQQQIDSIGDTITNEEVYEAMELYQDEIDRIVASMVVDDETGEYQDETTITAEERAARTVILNDAARAYLQELQTEERREALSKAVTESNLKCMKLDREYQAALDAGDHALAEQLLNQLEAAKQELAVNKEKLAMTERSDIDYSDEDIEEALRLYGDEIYASVTDKLSDAMLYGSETGQWAIAYLEAHDMENTPENIRKVVSMAGLYQNYEAMLDRQDALLEEAEQAKKKAQMLREKGSVEDLTCARQLETIAAAYEKELAQLRKDIKKNDPGKEVILAKYREELEILRAERAGLVSVVNPNRDTYVKADKDTYDSKESVCRSCVDLRSFVESEENSHRAKIEEYRWFIEAVENGSILAVEKEMNGYYENANAYQVAADQYHKGAEMVRNAPVFYQTMMNAYETAQVKADYYRALAQEMESRYGEAVEASKSQASKQSYITSVNQKIEEEERAINDLWANYNAKLAKAEEEKNAAEAVYRSRLEEWDASDARRVEIDARIKELENEISEYY